MRANVAFSSAVRSPSKSFHVTMSSPFLPLFLPPPSPSAGFFLFLGGALRFASFPSSPPLDPTLLSEVDPFLSATDPPLETAPPPLLASLPFALLAPLGSSAAAAAAAASAAATTHSSSSSFPAADVSGTAAVVATTVGASGSTGTAVTTEAAVTAVAKTGLGQETAETTSFRGTWCAIVTTPAGAVGVCSEPASLATTPGSPAATAARSLLLLLGEIAETTTEATGMGTLCTSAALWPIAAPAPEASATGGGLSVLGACTAAQEGVGELCSGSCSCCSCCSSGAFCGTASSSRSGTAVACSACASCLGNPSGLTASALAVTVSCFTAFGCAGSAGWFGSASGVVGAGTAVVDTTGALGSIGSVTELSSMLTSSSSAVATGTVTFGTASAGPLLESDVGG
mmetsp:Transcript_44254/g.86574  ORF Transcript_44254/g.86574 Transcript_44254/m.86574 type:complete len:400 (+) Transcript_44254:3448-4647(+)